MYSYPTIIKLHETDAAGRLFFSHQFKLMHNAYESLLDKIGFDFAQLIREQNFFLPIVHAEADYKKPLFVGDQIHIEVTVDRVGETSFSFAYTLKNIQNELVGTGQTVHVTVDKKTQKKIPLPSDLRQAIVALKESV